MDSAMVKVKEDKVALTNTSWSLCPKRKQNKETNKLHGRHRKRNGM